MKKYFFFFLFNPSRKEFAFPIITRVLERRVRTFEDLEVKRKGGVILKKKNKIK